MLSQPQGIPKKDSSAWPVFGDQSKTHDPWTGRGHVLVSPICRYSYSCAIMMTPNRLMAVPRYTTGVVSGRHPVIFVEPVPDQHAVRAFASDVTGLVYRWYPPACVMAADSTPARPMFAMRMRLMIAMRLNDFAVILSIGDVSGAGRNRECGENRDRQYLTGCLKYVCRGHGSLLSLDPFQSLVRIQGQSDRFVTIHGSPGETEKKCQQRFMRVLTNRRPL